MLWLQRFGLGLVAAGLAGAQSAPETPIPQKKESVVVTGSYDPLPLDEADRSVRLLDVKGSELLANSYIDFLKLDSSLDIRARGANGVQTDLGVRGGTFGQTLVLLDGQRLNDVQSGHHNMDLPVPLEAIERIEILKGAGSTLYGADALGGVINIISRREEEGPHVDVRFRAGVGSFGTNQQRASVGIAGQAWSERLTFMRELSTGFMTNRDYRVLSFGSATHGRTRLGSTAVTLGYADKPFGAEQFYGNFNSWENTKTWFAGLRQDLGDKTEASVSYRRHSDWFVLRRGAPPPHNHHAVESWQGSLRRREDLGTNAKLYYGAEGYHDAIESSALGRHDRARGAGYVSLDVRALKRFSFTAGAREETYGAGRHQFSPSVSAGAWLTPRMKLRGSVSRAFRLPTYTDLFYRDPANVGNPLLRPERAWSYEGALDWSAGAVRGDVVVFQRRETDGIDYVRASPADIWRAENFSRLRFTGVEASLRWQAGTAHVFDLRYTGLRGAADALGGLQSKYVFNYPSQAGVAGWQGSFKGGVIARARIGALKRLGRDPYGVADLYVAQSRWRVRPFVQFTNLTDTVYQEIVGVAMPGRAVLGGVEIAVWGK